MPLTLDSQIQIYNCAMTRLYELPYVAPDEVPAARALLRRANLLDSLLSDYLDACSRGHRQGIFPDLGIKVTSLDDRSGGELGAVFARFGLLERGNRLVSRRVVPSIRHPHPEARAAAAAVAYWTCRLWNGDGSNEWLDHLHAYDAWRDLRSRGFHPRSSRDDVDRLGVPFQLLALSPKTLSLQFDLEERLLARGNIPGKGYLDAEVPLHSRAGLTRPYRTHVDGVAAMLDDFEASDWGPVPPSDDAVGLTVCISYRHFRNEPPHRGPYGSRGRARTSTISPKAREQLAIFLLCMNRFYPQVRFWCDAVLKSRHVDANNWESVGLLPYLTWPTLYISGYVDEPEKNSFNKLWVRIEQFCATYGRGTYIMSFDISHLEDENPWSRRSEISSFLSSTSGRLRGRHEGTHRTLYLLCRAVRYGLFEEFVGTWRKYFDETFRTWVAREEERLTSQRLVAVTPFVFSDEQLVAMKPETTLIFHPRRSTLSSGLRLKQALRPKWDSPISSAAEIDIDLFAFGEVWRRKCDNEEAEDAYIYISTSSSDFSNCWMCEVRHADANYPQGRLKQIVHYVSSCGLLLGNAVIDRRTPSAGPQRNAPPLKTALTETGDNLVSQWFREAFTVIDRLRGAEDSSFYEMRGFSWGKEFEKFVIETGLPNWEKS